MSISSMYDPIKQINQAIEIHSIVKWAIVFPSRVKHMMLLILESRSSVRWPSGLRRQTKAFPTRLVIVSSGPKGRGFESPSHQ
jgi:hypothetical protein